MGIRSGFFNSRNGDRRYDAQVFVDIFTKLKYGKGVAVSAEDNPQLMLKLTA